MKSFSKWILLCVVLAGCNESENATPTARVASSVAPTLNVIRTYPMTIAASNNGMFWKGDPWFLSVNSAGRAALTIQTAPASVSREFQVTEDQMTKLREQLIQQDFFDLSSQYGGVVLDGTTEHISITIGDHTKSVQIDHLITEAGEVPSAEAMRAVEVFYLVRDWFDDEEAADPRPEIRELRKMRNAHPAAR